MPVNQKLLDFLEKHLKKADRKAHDNYAFYCPFCHHKKKKLEINVNLELKEFAWHCWVCNAGGTNLISLFTKNEAEESVIKELRTLIKKPRRTEFETSLDQTSKTFQPKLPKEFKPLSEKDTTPEYRNALHYIRKKRNITPADILRYNLGYCESGKYNGMIIVPSYDSSGNLNFFTGRAYYETDFGAHLIPSEYSRDVIGFELFLNWNEPITIVEGAFDAIAARHNAVPLFGKFLSKAFLKKIIENKVKTIYLALDNDALKQTIEHAEYFMNNGIDIYIVDITDKDPAKIGTQNFLELKRNTPKLTQSKLMKLKIQFG